MQLGTILGVVGVFLAFVVFLLWEAGKKKRRQDQLEIRRNLESFHRKSASDDETL